MRVRRSFATLGLTAGLLLLGPAAWADASSGATTPQLPRTGVPVGALSALGLGLLAVGGVTLLAGRRTT